MAEHKPTDTRTRWMLVAIGFNTIASLTAIALWIAAPGGRPGAQSSSAEAASTAAAKPLGRPVPPRAQARNTSLPSSPGRPRLIPRDDDMPPLQTMPLPSREAAGLSAAVKELAVRLHLNPTVLVDHAGDEHGEVPAAAAERLERAHGAGTALAARLRIEGPQAQAFAGIITYYALSLLREEKSAAPGSVDAERIQEIEDAAINDVRAGYGEDAAAEAAREIASLRP